MEANPKQDFEVRHGVVIADPLASMLGFQLRRTSVAVMTALAEELAPLGILPSEASLLMMIGANPGCTQSGLSRALRAQPANMVPLINKLVQAGSIDREQGKGRAIALTLTNTGNKLYGDVKAAFARNETRIARNLPKELRDALIPALMRICKDACCKDEG